MLGYLGPGSPLAPTHGGPIRVLIHLLMTTPEGAIWADARACGSPAIATGDAMKHRPQAPVFGGSYGTHVSNGNATKRPTGLGGSAG